jgi:hypothetical protein
MIDFDEPGPPRRDPARRELAFSHTELSFHRTKDRLWRDIRMSVKPDEGSGRAVRAGRDGQRTLPDEPAIQACDWTR